MTEPDVAADEGADAEQSGARHSIGRNLAAMASSQVLNWILGTVLVLAYPRFLGPDGVGRLQLAFSLWLIAQVCVNLGTGTYLVLEMARDRARGVTLVGPILLIRLAAFAVASLGMAGYVLVAGLDREMVALVAITGLAMLLTILQEVFGSAFSGMEQMSYSSIAFVTSKIVLTGLVLAVLFAGGGVIEIAWTTTVSGLLGLGLFALFYRRQHRVTFARPDGGYGLIVRASSSYMVGSIILVVYLQIDVVVMSMLIDDAALGWYASADTLIHSLLFIPAMLMGVLFPVMGRLHTTDAEAGKVIVHRAFSLLTIAGVAVGFGAAAIGEPFAVLMFGEDFRRGGHVLSVFAMSLPLIFLTMLLGQVAYTSGREKFWSKLMAIGVVMSVAFDFAVVPVFDREVGNGAVAGALGYFVTESFMVVVAVRRITPELFSSETLVRISKILVAGTAMFLVAWRLSEYVLLVPIAAGAGVFVTLALALRVLTDSDRELLATLGRRIRRLPPAPDATDG
ncbi:MAG: flippase [Ilumatobacter sp.]|uniref:flippase n=1 Tax=Ilumatobacter sp. TaxID=1967498 RepID=UPI00262344D0|nr:flippase [Ilumatobacter sp.]MDJ0768693.1 flippase [Ilumatobacter sp.]